MSLVKRTVRRISSFLILVVALATVLALTASSGHTATPGQAGAADSPTSADSPEMQTLLNQGLGVVSPSYFKTPSQSLVAAADGDDNASFYTLGQLLVSDGFGNIIIDLGREMNGAWYEWGEGRAPVTELNAFILAWRQIVTTMRSVPGQHFKFLWTLYPGASSAAEAWPGASYVDYIGADIFDWYGGGNDNYPQLATGGPDYAGKWRQILTAQPGGLDWLAAFSQTTGKPIIIPEWGLDFHSFGGQDDPYFITNMLAWMKAHHAIGLYWGGQHLTPTVLDSGPLIRNQGEAAQQNTPEVVNAMGQLVGGRLQYAGVYLPDGEALSDTVDQAVLRPWLGTGYQLILSVPVVPNPPAIPSYSGPPEPTPLPYQLADYPDAVAAFQQGLARGGASGLGVQPSTVPPKNQLPEIQRDARRISSRLSLLLALAGVLALIASCGKPAGPSPASDAAAVRALLADGQGAASTGYFTKTSQALVATAAGKNNAPFYSLGKLLVNDGLGATIIDLGREMNGTWYEWSEHRAPSSEPGAYARAWRQVVATMRSVPGQHFKFLWTVYPGSASIADAWPGASYVDYIGTDIFDWYGGPGSTYPHTASGALDHAGKWQQIRTAEPGGLNWMAAFSRATGKPIVIPEWGLDFHTFGGQDDPSFITNMLAWMKAHDAIGLYWGTQHLTPAAAASGPLIRNQGEAGQQNTTGAVNALGQLMGGRLQYAGIYLPDRQWPSDRVDQPILAAWQGQGYQLILSVPLVANPPAIKSYSGPPEPGNQPYQLIDYADAVAALRQGA
jgi:Glycosyl hydrolase family 26